jgi:hypothetical protein
LFWGWVGASLNNIIKSMISEAADPELRESGQINSPDVAEVLRRIQADEFA